MILIAKREPARVYVRKYLPPIHLPVQCYLLDDLVTAVAFDHCGDHVAIGDKAGRICIFEAQNALNCINRQQGRVRAGRAPSSESKSEEPESDEELEFESGSIARSIEVARAERLRKMTGNYGSEGDRQNPLDYCFYVEFKSHEPGFDCLKNIPIEERIHQVEWLPATNQAMFLLSSNSKVIHLTKVCDREPRRPFRGGASLGVVGTHGEFVVPSQDTTELEANQPTPYSYRRRVFANAHQFSIHSISVNSDGETFLSSDDCVVHLWNTNRSDECFNLVNIKPPRLEDINQCITTASFHPTACNIMLYGLTTGAVKLCDMRDAALCSQYAKTFHSEEDPATKSFFSEIVNMLSDATITPDENYIVARDYLSVKIWDVRMESKLLSVVPVQEYLRMELCKLYEEDHIFDQFEIALSPDGKQFVTGGYSNNFIIHNMATNQTATIEAMRTSARKKVKANKSLKKQVPKQKKLEAPDIASIQWDKKALHTAWHPNRECVAIAGCNKLYIYQAVSTNNGMLT